MRLLVATVALLLIAVNIASQNIEEPADMKACIEEIRAWGMSEQAKGSIMMVAGNRLGGTSWYYIKDESSGTYGFGMRGNRCNLPNDNPIEAEREKMAYQYKLDREIMRLKEIADSDGSGFVSTTEGREFLNLVQFGHKASFIIEEEKSDIDAIVVGLNQELSGGDETAFRDKLNEYNTLKTLAVKHGIDDLPNVVIE
jgi:hypothetical protein